MAGNSINQANGNSASPATQSAEIEPCRFPRFDSEEEGLNRLLSISVEAEQLQQLQKLYAKDQDVVRSLLRLAWALVLGCYTGLEDVCFGFLESRPENMVNGARDHAEDVSMTIARMVLVGTSTISEMIEGERQNKRIRFSPASAKLAEEAPFDTVMILEDSASADGKSGAPTRDLNDNLETEVRRMRFRTSKRLLIFS